MTTWAVLLWLCAAAPKSTDIERDLVAGEFERALKKIDAALKKTSGAGEVARLQLSRAQALLALGDAAKARAAFALALAADPAAQLDASRVGPDAIALFEKVREEVAPPKPVVSELKQAPPPEEVLLVPAPVVAAAPAVVVAAPRESSGLGLIPLVAGIGFAGAGGVLIGLAADQRAQLVNPMLPPLSAAEEQAAVSNGRMFQTLGWAGLGVGLAAIAIGALLLAMLMEGGS